LLLNKHGWFTTVRPPSGNYLKIAWLWFSKICSVNHLTPEYMHINDNSHHNMKERSDKKDNAIVYVVCTFGWFSKRK